MQRNPVSWNLVHLLRRAITGHLPGSPTRRLAYLPRPQAAHRRRSSARPCSCRYHRKTWYVLRPSQRLPRGRLSEPTRPAHLPRSPDGRRFSTAPIHKPQVSGCGSYDGCLTVVVGVNFLGVSQWLIEPSVPSRHIDRAHLRLSQSPRVSSSWQQRQRPAIQTVPTNWKPSL